MLRRNSRSTERKQRRGLNFEALEPRAMMSASTNSTLHAPPAPPVGPTMEPMLTVAQITKPIMPLTSATTTGPFNPFQIRQIYGFDKLSLNGAGTTIAIVDAYNDPTIVQDLATFDTEFSLPTPQLTIHKTTTTNNAKWDLETALDVEWAHAIAPAANILLVEATSDSTDDLMSAVNYARNASGVSVVSMSFSTPEFEQSWNPGSWGDENQTDYDSGTFVTPQGHRPVSFVSSAGDVGSRVVYPSTSPNVLAVGGTVITANEATKVGPSSVPNNWQTMSYDTEAAWSDGGGGFSGVESRPAYQNGFDTSSMRSTPDVAYGASGFWVFDSNNGDWNSVGGTSAGTPQWAGIIALANQERAQLGGDTLSNTVADIYQLPSSDFHDITTGSTGVYSAKVGFDQTTGRGTPIANLLVNDLARSEWLPPPAGPIGPGTGIGISTTPPTQVLAATVTPTTTTTTTPTTTSTTMKASIANVVASPFVSPTMHAAGPTTLRASDAADQLFEAMFGFEGTL
jgi:subtilase family serine protease